LVFVDLERKAGEKFRNRRIKEKKSKKFKKVSVANLNTIAFLLCG
jgi:hypothetical protein